MFIFEAADALAKEKTFLPITTRFEFVSLDKQNIDHEPIKLADGADLYIGLDSEWVTRNGSNKVLSYQSYCINDEGQELGQIYYPENDKRFSFEKFISMVVEGRCSSYVLVHDL